MKSVTKRRDNTSAQAALKGRQALTALFLAFLLCACSSQNEPDVADDPVGSELGIDNATSLSLGQDGDTIWVGTDVDAFFAFVPTRNTVSRFDLPESKNSKASNAKTYCIHSLGNRRFLIGRKNDGLVYLDYGATPSDGKHLHGMRSYRSSTDRPPYKGQNYSVYQILPVGDKIVLSGTNGLMYLDRSDIPRANGYQQGEDSLCVRMVRPLQRLRDNRMEFVQHKILPLGDTAVLTATDDGLFMVKLRDFDSPSENAAIKIDNGRFLSAIFNARQLVALRANKSGKEICSYNMPLHGGMSPETEKAQLTTIALTRYCDQIMQLGAPGEGLPEGDYSCVNSWVFLGPHFYYTRNGHLLRADISADKKSENSEAVAFNLGEYAISTHDGIWRKEPGGYSFVGAISNPLPIISATYSSYDHNIYIASAGGIYSVSTRSHFGIPSNRDMVLTKPIAPDETDRVNIIMADSSYLYVGSRCYLKRYDIQSSLQYNSKCDTITFNSLDAIFECPQIVGLRPEAHGILVETLNHGVWQLRDTTINHAGKTITQTIVTPTELPSLNTFGVDILGSPLPLRPKLSWEYIYDRIWILCLLLCALIGLVSIVRAIRRRSAKDALLSYSNITELIDKIERDKKGMKKWPSFVGLLLPCRRAVKAFLANPADESAKDNALQAISKLDSTLETRIFKNARRLALSLERKLDNSTPTGDSAKAITQIMLRFVTQVKHLVDTSENDNELPDMLARSSQAHKVHPYYKQYSHVASSDICRTISSAMQVYQCYLEFVDSLMAALRSSRGDDAKAYSFTPEHLDALWELVLLLDTENAISTDKYPIYGWGSKDNTPFACYTFVSLMFYNLAKPTIEGRKPLRDIARGVYNFSPVRDKRGYNNHGSAYKIVARSMTPGYISLSPKPLVPCRLSDALWNAYFCHCDDDIRMMRTTPGVKKSLSAAISGAANLE